MKEYRITFGMKYRDEPHPNAAWAHPDGWLSVFTDDPRQVRLLTEAMVGHVDGDPRAPIAFAFDYAPEDNGYPTIDRYPRGELARVQAIVNVPSAVLNVVNLENQR